MLSYMLCYNNQKGGINMKIDPVCNMSVDETKNPITCSYKEQTYYFCCAGCKEKFISNPDKYLKK
jgi:Cu+-exporting ATPase